MLITELAYFLLLLAFVLSAFQIILPSYGIVSNKSQLQSSLQQLAPSLAWGQFIAVALSFIGLMAGFYFNDFSLVYVANHSNSLLPWYYKLSATWGGHEGSLLLWITILAGWGAMVASFSKSLQLAMRARILVVLSVVQFMMTAMLIFSSSPFERSATNGFINLPLDGADLNPLLQDFGLIVHPPLLYMGYVGMVVPFAFCVAALWAGRLDAVWTRWSRPWALVAWGFLTLGIALGSWWAYYELGWGGWWFWDPVENASLLPWLVCTALIHSLAVTEKRGVFKAWTIMLAIFAFALSLLGTFLVRSGVITSVHSFASDPTRGLLILLILAMVIGAGLALFALRGWRLTVESHYQLKSRETMLVINNIIILIATLVVLLGTLYPIIADSLQLGQVSVGAPYFNALFVPLSWLLLLAMGVGVVTRWKRDNRPLLGVGVAIASSSLVLAGVMLFFVQSALSVSGSGFGSVAVTVAGSKLLNVGMTTALCAWVLGWAVYDIKDKTKHGKTLKAGLAKLSPSYWGMQVAHMGVLVTAMGIALTSTHSIEKDVAMSVGDTVSVEGYDFSMIDMYAVTGKNYDGIASEMMVQKNGKQITSLHPEKRTYVVTQMPMTEAAIDANLWRDLYVALGEPIEKSGNDEMEDWAVRIYVKPFVRWIWLGAILMAVGAVISMLDRRYRLQS